jgi:hypothetical protein
MKPIILLCMMIMILSCRSYNARLVQHANQERYAMTCVAPDRRDRQKHEVISITLENGGYKTHTCMNWQSAFFAAADSVCYSVDPVNFIKKNLAYPGICRELEIQGKWIYELYFDQSAFQTWKCVRAVENGQHMEVEIDRVFGRM